MSIDKRLVSTGDNEDDETGDGLHDDIVASWKETSEDCLSFIHIYLPRKPHMSTQLESVSF